MIPCGETLPINNPHAISVSMPTMQDVFDYEERTGETTEKIKSAYPRFMRHPYIMRLVKYLECKYELPSRLTFVLLSSQEAVVNMCVEKGVENLFEVDEPFGVVTVRRNSEDLKAVLNYIQVSGSILSSRAAEDYLHEVGEIEIKFEEELASADSAESTIKQALAEAYHQSSEDVLLAPSGMNAVYSAVRGVLDEREKEGREVLIQLGWLYSDSMTVVARYAKESVRFLDVEQLDALEDYLQANGHRVAGVLTEVPTNPQLKCVNLPRLRKLCDEYQIPLLIDTTIATPFLFDFTPYADVIIESLSKFASGNADLLMGAVVMNANRSAMHMKSAIFERIEPVCIGDLQRMAHSIEGYEERVRKSSANAAKLVKHFKQCDYVEKVFSHESGESCVGLVSVKFKGDFKTIYDALNLPKGPSLGTEFTLVMPYTYLAHYDLIQSEEGRELLAQINLPIDLLRISVGTEPIEEIIVEFERIGLLSM